MVLNVGKKVRIAGAGAIALAAGIALMSPVTPSAQATSTKAPAAKSGDQVAANSVTMKLRSTGHSISIPLPQGSPEPTINDGARAAPAALTSALRGLWSSFPGKAGIAVMKADGSWIVSYRGDEPMPQQSVSKLWVAISVMDAVDKGKLRLDDQVTLKKSDMTLFHQPIAGLIGPNGYTTTVASLLKRAMTQSDNTANDSLLRVAGGPQAVRAFIERKQLGRIRFGPGERLLQSQIAGLAWHQDYALGRRFYTARAAVPAERRKAALDAYLADPIDGASPDAIAGALAKLARGELLSPASTRLLMATMERTSSGPNRLKAGVPAGWRFGHKTGTGQILSPVSTGYNDIGIMTAPDGTRYAVVVMIASTTASVPDRMAMMQAVSRAVGQHHR